MQWSVVKANVAGWHYCVKTKCGVCAEVTQHWLWKPIRAGFETKNKNDDGKKVYPSYQTKRESPGTITRVETSDITPTWGTYWLPNSCIGPIILEDMPYCRTTVVSGEVQYINSWLTQLLLQPAACDSETSQNRHISYKLHCTVHQSSWPYWQIARLRYQFYRWTCM